MLCVKKLVFVKYYNYLSGLLCNSNLRYGLATGGMGRPGVRPARNPGMGHSTSGFHRHLGHLVALPYLAVRTADSVAAESQLQPRQGLSAEHWCSSSSR